MPRLADKLRAGLPVGAVEVVEKRSLYGKVFSLGGGRFRYASAVGPVHVPRNPLAWGRGESTVFDEIDTDFERVNSVLRVRNAWYNLEVPTGVVGYRYVSKLSGAVNVKLLTLGLTLAPVVAPRISGNEVWWDEVLPGLDIFLRASVAGVELFKRIKDATAPRSFTWEIEESDPPVLRVKTLTMGNDNADGAVIPGRSGVGRIRRPIEMIHSRTPFEMPRAGIRRFQTTETWTGRTFTLAHTPTREKTFFDDCAYPILIDQDVSEAIAADNDDGQQQSSAGTAWTTHYQAQTDIHIIYNGSGGVLWRPGYRFQTVAIPQGATIDDATFTINVRDLAGAATTGTLFGNDIDDAPAWATGAGPTEMTPTTASLVWVVPDATGAFASDVAAIVQEIVNRAGWVSGNDLALGVPGTVTGLYKYILDFGNGSNFATLVVNYTAGGGRTTKNTRAWTHGTQVGMGHRMPV